MERTFIITGGNSGLGYCCALNIAVRNPENHVVIASRKLEKSQKAAAALANETNNPNICAMMLDLASLASVREFYKSFTNSKLPPLFGLVCNAISGSGKKPVFTQDGFEMTFATGHLGHFLLSNLLLKDMQDGGRIVFVSSDQHNPLKIIGKIHYTDALEIACPKNGNHNLRYSMTKLCNIYCAYEMSERIKSENRKQITVNAFNPGFMADTGLAKPDGLAENLLKHIAPLIARLLRVHSTAEKSGKLLANLMTDNRYNGLTGRYFDRENEKPSSPLSYNRKNAANLWQRSAEFVKLQSDETIFKP
jgi:NAD(P)-dependent dehydrogenase (short-subunit alcohol dehydrogenase family)